MKKKALYIVFLIFAGMQTALGQVNFFTNDESDSLAMHFYQRNKKVTVLGVANYPSMQFGTALFLHNNENKLSYFFEVKTNGSRRYIITGEECYGEATREKEVSYSATTFNVGLSQGFTKNWFAYVGLGVVLKTTDFENEIEDNFRYTVPYNDVWFNVAVGAMYVFDKNYAVMIGTDLYDRCVNVGIGYTW